eukprot:CAMPEP_0197022656 /NCGR_PEP_ID=MMETSP1384-20130603/3470_1 /TAXON_ID=29189 /ORGANISM="Ammonia sp." /LENGTH=787 /DNA_ID=CAMNT_0042450733 /DNA_START=99 /DNA_END=2462 /DNA_ORIENTATION=+
MSALWDDDMSDGSSYNEDEAEYPLEDEWEEESEEIILEEELPHEEDEYEESDSYEYPYPTSSDDSWAALSSDEAIQKIIEKLPTYSSHSSGDDRANDQLSLDAASDSDAGSFIEHTDEKDYRSDLLPSQIDSFQPSLYLARIETYQLYVVPHSDDEEKTDGADADDEAPDTTDTAYTAGGAVQDLSIHKAENTDESKQTMDALMVSPVSPSPETPLPAEPREAQGQAQQDQHEQPTEPEPEPEHQEADTPAQIQVTTDTAAADHDAEAVAGAETDVASATDVDRGTPPQIDTESDRKEPSEESKENAARTPKMIQPTQSEIPVISEDAAVDTDAKDSVVEFSDTEKPVRRGRDAPRRQTKTRIVIKKVAAKRAPHRFKENMKVRIVDLSEALDGHIGIIKFVGLIDGQKMTGIQLIEDGVYGDCDGSYKEQRYFTCDDKKGIFLSIKNVKKFIDEEARKKSDEFKLISRQRRRVQRNNAQMYGKRVDNLWAHRIDLVKQKKYRIVHKPGPREFGRIEYFGGDEEYVNVLNDTTHWLAPRLTAPRKSKGAITKAEPKAGPREIGRHDDFEGIEYDEAAEEAKRQRKKAEQFKKNKEQWEKRRQQQLKNGAISPNVRTPTGSRPSSARHSEDKEKFPMVSAKNGKEKGKEKKSDSKSSKLAVSKPAQKKRAKSALSNSKKKKTEQDDKNANKAKGGGKKGVNGDKKTNVSKSKNTKSNAVAAKKKEAAAKTTSASSKKKAANDASKKGGNGNDAASKKKAKNGKVTKSGTKTSSNGSGSKKKKKNVTSK